jgi:small subunit ribosomal protein S10
MSKNLKRFRIRLKAYDYKLLDRAASDIADSALRSGADVRGPFPLPTTLNKWTVLRGPHVNKKSREQFERRTHHRLLDILNPQKQTIDALKKVELPAGVHVRISS